MRSRIITLILIIIGLVLGSFLGEITSSIPFLSWLNYGKIIGIPNFSVNLYALQFNFGLTFNCTIACIIGLIASLFIYYKLIR